MSWAVKPGDRVEQFDLICEVQSDKAAVEITSRFEGIIEKIHYEVGDLAKVGSALLDIDVSSDSHDGAHLSDTSLGEGNDKKTQELTSGSQLPVEQESLSESSMPTRILDETDQQASPNSTSNPTPITPALRRLLKEKNIDIKHVKGTGKEGTILKEDIMRYIKSDANESFHKQQAKIQPSTVNGADYNDRRVTMTPIQMSMFKTMTRSLAIPHFLYTHKVDLTAIMDLCERFKSNPSLALRHHNGNALKLTPLPFIMKAVSDAITEVPILNAILDASASGDGQNPELIMRGQHNFGMAVDSPKGLLVPVVRDVKRHSLLSLAAEISRLGQLARDGKLSPNDMIDGTIVVSNIGSIGGQVVAPVILPPMVAIMAIGKVESEPVFEKDSDGIEKLVKKKRAILSWSADHRVIDGATVARCAQQVQRQLEMPESLGLDLD
ncbi:uncharacterized protein N7503_002535 [Penicillium pulvis]|uniref:uncharacterized protein n=1 Tax=Penicillium pulvis TaxID=1562058 RepID=UPI00254712D8|nr:uncharacterized protein N7503_002535 [Penicillium pulvis]KAJ5810317.1 hypothetical protein N7503_002535 [Penicillium pulvis]